MYRLMVQMRQLETENCALRDHLGFFEKLLPVARNEGLVYGPCRPRCWAARNGAGRCW